MKEKKKKKDLLGCSVTTGGEVHLSALISACVREGINVLMSHLLNPAIGHRGTLGAASNASLISEFISIK